MKNSLQLSLFLLRLSVFIVMLMWTLNKFIRPEHTAAIYSYFYYIPNITTTLAMVLGALELVVLIGFLLGFLKTLTYGLVLLFHAISTISCFQQYSMPFQSTNLLFFAAFPMLAACIALFLLRKEDRLLAIS